MEPVDDDDDLIDWAEEYGVLIGAAFGLDKSWASRGRCRQWDYEDGDATFRPSPWHVASSSVVGGWLVNLRFPFFPEGGERLLIFALPYGSLLLAAGIDRTWKYAYAGRVALILLLTAAAGGVFTFYTTPRYSEHDYRALLREIVQQGRNEDALLAIFPWQVGYWRAYTPQGFLEYSFVETVDAMHPMYVIRALGGGLFVLGALIMAYNIWMTIASPEASEVPSGRPELAPAE